MRFADLPPWQCGPTERHGDLGELVLDEIRVANKAFQFL